MHNRTRVKIDKVEETGVWVVPDANTACQGCAQSASCSAFKTLTAESALFIADTSGNYAKGDKAQLSIAPSKLAQASFLVYGLPLLLMLLAALLAEPFNNEALSLIGMVLGLGLGFLLASYVQSRYFHQSTIKIQTDNISLNKESM